MADAAGVTATVHDSGVKMKSSVVKYIYFFSTSYVPKWTVLQFSSCPCFKLLGLLVQKWTIGYTPVLS